MTQYSPHITHAIAVRAHKGSGSCTVSRGSLCGAASVKRYFLPLRLLVLGIVMLGGVFVQPVLAKGPEQIYAENGIVASRSRLASAAGVEVMQAGGNAIDAAVATGFALAVTYPSAGNLGGGGFMVIHLKDGTTVTNDHREMAPAAAHRDMYLDEQGEVVAGLSTASHLAVGVPGTVAGLLDVLERYGSLSRKQVITPALRLARDGFTLSHDLARQFARRREAFTAHPPTLAKFSNRKGEPLAAGDLWRQPELAAVLKRIIREGRDGFYKGKTAALIAQEMRTGGGIITEADLAAYQSRWREPIRGRYRGYDVVSMPPPSSGGVLVVQMLNMLEPYDLAGMGFGSASLLHHLIEVERRAYADRAEHLGDMDFYPVPIAQLTDKKYAQQRMQSFDAKRASRSADIFPGQWPDEPMDTTHASIIDGDGNAVAYTTTLNLSYGAKFIAAGTGVLMNNEMDDFSVKRDTPNAFGLIGRKANEIAPGKRMLSSMTPTIVLKDGKPWLVTGSPGGSTIITTTLQVILNAIDHDMDLSDAVSAPRLHHQWQPDRVIYERLGFSPDTLARLEAMAHENLFEMPFGRGIGDANSVMVVDGVLQGMADPRNDGAAVGF